MDKVKFKKALGNIFTKNDFDFKKKVWEIENEQLIKIIKLEKSNFSQSYYLNYGFIIKDLNLAGYYMHISFQLGSKIKEENERIKMLLNIENTITDDIRIEELRYYIERILIPRLKDTNTPSDIKHLIEKTGLLDVPIEIKRYLKIE